MIAERVRQGAFQMGIELNDEAAERFELYYHLLVEGNKRMNLTAVLEPEEAVDRHFLDCLAPVAMPGLIPQGASLADVGTGAGFPGLPLLIARPDLRLTLVDSLNKRLEFLRGVLDSLGLQAEIVHMRAEDFSRLDYREQFDIAAARAVAPLSPLLEYLLPCVRRGGYALCWKGPDIAQEAEQARKAIFLLGGKARVPVEYAVPNREWKHNLFIVDKVSNTPKSYPRKAGTPAKNPL